jgi:hypothetical protein
MKKVQFALIVSLIFIGARLSTAQAVMCPATVNVRQEIQKPVAGWESFLADSPVRLANVTFFDGPPKEKASLVDTQRKKEAGHETATWQFTRTAGQHIWIACSYSGTAVMLTQQLSEKINSCTVTYNSRQLVAGTPMIESIVCK